MTIIRGADRYLSDHNLYLSVHFSHKSAESERRLVQNLIDRGCQCIIAFPCSATENIFFYIEMQQQGVHFIFIDRQPPRLISNFVCCDNIHGGSMATEHLLEYGVQRPAYLSMTLADESSALEQRLTGMRLALIRAGKTLHDALVRFTTDEQSLCLAILELLALPEPPDGLFCANDFTALQVMRILDELNIAVPESMKIIGFDNLPVTNQISIPISTIAQQFEQMGIEAATIAHNILTGKQSGFTQTVLPVSLVARKSCS